MFSKYASIIVDVAIDKPLDYGIPEHLLNVIKRGTRVKVNLNGKLQGGYVYALKENSSFPRVKPLQEIVADQEPLSEDLFELALWISRYYCAPLSKTLKVMLPASLRKEIRAKEQLFVSRKQTREELRLICEEIRNKSPRQAAILDVMLQVKKGILLTELLEKTGGTRGPVDSLVAKGCLQLDSVRTDRSPLIDEEYILTKSKRLNEDQTKACAAISESLALCRFDVHLLHGVTGSGKTEVYLQSLAKALESGKGAIVLVPEISLTQQTIERFRSRFKEQIAVLHHRLSHGERFEAWKEIAEGKAPIVIGARSAIFSPVPNLGLIIVDEEHEASYKNSEEAPCYHARDVAVMRGKFVSCPVILGSATPSLESYYNAENGKYHLSPLPLRAEASSIPHVTIVDMKREFERANGYTNFSQPLLDGIKKRYAVGEQTILFLNRRGYHTTFFCQKCRKPLSCNHCDQALTFHLGDNCLSCHLCGFTLSPPPKECPSCRDPHLMQFKGVGTELLERSLKALFPEIRTLRIDADTTRHKGSHQLLLRQFGTGKADVLIGTQMIAKGLHFPEVTLVGIINCDGSLNIPDFRASETVFQLITQVSGRAGRGASAGEVILQTCMPQNSTILHASKQDYPGFYREEIEIRKAFGFPPAVQMAKLSISGPEDFPCKEMAERLRDALKKELPADYQLHPVVPCGHVKIKDKWRYQFLIRGANMGHLSRLMEKVRLKVHVPSSYRVVIDVNPLSTFF